MATHQSLVPQISTRAWIILGGDALSALGSGLTLPFFLVYLHRVRGIDLAVAGLVLSTVAVIGLVGNPVGGWLADRIGSRRAVVVGLVVAAGGTAALAAVHTATDAFAAAALYGFGMAVLWPAEDALLATAVRADQRPQVFAVHHATLNAGFSIGGLAAALVVGFASPGSFVLVYLLDAASFLAFAVVVARLGDAPVEAGVLAASDEVDETSGGYREVFRDRVFRRLWVLVVLLVTAGYAQFHAAFPVYATGPGGLSARGLGIAFAANTITVVFAQLVVLRLMDGHRRTRGVMLSAAFVAAAWIVTLTTGLLDWQAAGLMLLAGAMVLFGLGETLMSPTLPALVNDLAPDRLRGRYNGTYALGWTTGYIVGPAIAGFALAAGIGHALFAGMAAVMGVAVFGAWRLERLLPAHTNLIGSRVDHASDAVEPREPAVPLVLAGGTL